jgi:hypothetical protein
MAGGRASATATWASFPGSDGLGGAFVALFSYDYGAATGGSGCNTLSTDVANNFGATS